MAHHGGLAEMFARILSKDIINSAPPHVSQITAAAPPPVRKAPCQSSRPLVSNLPLPRELRDEIYGYLLHSDAARQIPEEAEAEAEADRPISLRNMLSAAHIYKFQTAMLGVNKVIAQESKEYLLKYNSFVLIRYNSPSFEKQLHALDVPILATNPSHHPETSLEITIFWPFGPYYAIYSDDGEAAPEKETGTVLMLLHDLPKLLRMLRFTCQYANGPITYIVSARGAPLQLDRSLRCDLPVVSFRISNTGRAHRLSPAEETGLLQGISTVVGLGRHLDLVGFKFVPAADLERVKIAVASTLACLRGLLWERLDTMLALKQEVDKLALSGRLHLTTRKYQFLIDFTQCGKFRAPRTDSTAMDNASYNAYVRYRILVHDLICSRVVTKISSNQYALSQLRDTYTMAINNQRAASTYNLNRAAFEKETWFVCAVALAGLALGGEVKHSDLVKWVKAIDIGQGLATDALKPLKSFLEARSPGSKIRLPSPSLTSKIFPLTLFNSQNDTLLPSRPRGLASWQDEAHMRELAPVEKQSIINYQWEGNLPITKLD